MKKIIASIFIGSLLLIAGPASASGFLSFDQQIRIGPIGALTVQERINVDFATPRHGIFRDLPVDYKTTAGNSFSLRVKIVSVMDDNGTNLPYTTSRANGFLTLKIGDPNATVSGRQTYIITYSISRATLYLPDHDELYWNAIVEPWGDLGLPDETKVTVILPKSVEAGLITTRCFTTVGSNVDGNCKKTISAGAAQFSATGTPLTIVVGWPKGVVAAPAPIQQIQDWLADNWIIFWPLLAFIGLFLLWFKKGRDPRIKTALVVQYEPPEKATPAEMGILINERAGATEITATIVNLAVRGYLNIIEKKSDKLFGAGQTYSFELKNASVTELNGFEKIVMNGLFGAGAAAGTVATTEALQTTFYTAVRSAKIAAGDAVVARGWFSKSPAIVRAAYMGAGAVYMFIIFFIFPGGFSAGPTWVVSLLLPGLFALYFGYFMPARTMAGTAAYALALGFKEYLSKAEKYRLKWEEKENIFENYLPYAMVCGVVDKWAKAFEGLQTQPPSWYRGGNFNAWSPIIFASTLNTATSTISHSIMTAPSAKGGGGFGGGGFGGGGFGGGGGGSW